MRDRRLKNGALAALVAALGLLAAVGVATADITQQGNIRILFHGGIAPAKLPRKGTAPVGVQMGAKIQTVNGEKPPRLSQIVLDINSHGVISAKGLPTCALGKLQNSNPTAVRNACGDAEVGHGNVTIRVAFPGQGEFSANGPLYAFNARIGGKQGIFAYVQSAGRFATSFVIKFVVHKTKGTYGTSLVGKVPSIASGAGYISAFDLSLKRRYSSHGEKRSYVSASCPLPAEVNVATFPLVRSTYMFEDGTNVTSVLRKECRARG